MAVIPIRTVPDPVLRQKARRIKTIDRAVRKLIGDMQETLKASNGVGLAAPQVGVSLRLIVISLPRKEQKNEEFVIINPEVVRRKGERILKEGCLSIPGYFGEIKRSESVKIKGLDRSGKEIKLHGEDLLGQALEHEIDHLNGVLYVDHLESQDKLHEVEPESESEPESETSRGLSV
jgi:peptide deformylase